jgi:Cys-rich repeat protein
MSYKNFRPLLWLGALSFLACHEANTNTDRDTRTVLLEDANGDGYAASEACGVEPGAADDSGDSETAGDCVILANPDGCAFIKWSEEHTIVTDANGNIVNETYTTCTQCLDENSNPVGDEECSSGGLTEPISCTPIGDPTLNCMECTNPEGVVYSSCDRPPVYCSSDADCSDGQICDSGLTTPGCDDTNNCPKPPPDATGICATPTEECFSDLDCNSGEVCEFIHEPCPEGEACSTLAHGKCVPAPDECEQITDHEACVENSSCRWLAFAPINCPEGETCPVGMCEDAEQDECSQITDHEACVENSSCRWLAFAPINCPEGETCPVGMCETNDDQFSCNSLTDEQSCSSNGCQWNLADPACLGGPSPEGCQDYCTDPQPEDECSQITEQETCVANPDCDWFAFGRPCIEGEPCISGVCQMSGDDTVGGDDDHDCGDGAMP